MQKDHTIHKIEVVPPSEFIDIKNGLRMLKIRKITVK